MTVMPKPVCPRIWPDFSTTARHRSCSRLAHRPPRFPARSTSIAPRPRGGWVAERFSSWETRALAPGTSPEGVAAFDYAPFSLLFPRAAAVVFPGGIGTTGLAMRSGRPMLVVPHAHDQPDTADRLTRLGIARTIDRHRYTAKRVAMELGRLLDDPALLRAGTGDRREGAA